MLHLPLRTSIWLLVIIAFFHSTTAERYRCSLSKEKCVFPFEDGGVTYNECKSGLYKPWCKSDGSHGWAYCEVCEEDKTTKTSTTSTTTSTTIQPTTTSPATTTNQPTATNSTTSTTDPPAIITKTTHLTSTVRTTTSTPTTDNIPISNTRGTIWSIPENTTTSTPKTTTSTSSPTTTTINLADDGATAVKEVDDEFLDSTTQEKDLNDGATEPSNIVREPMSTEKTEAPTTVPVSTTQPTTAKVCTHSGEPCHFPFKYSGKMYYSSCVEGLAYSWCYTDASIDDYTYCIPCTESSTSTTSTSTTTSTTSITTTLATTTTSANVMAESSTKQPKTSIRKVLKEPRIVELPETVSTSSSPALTGGPVVPHSSLATTRHGLQKPADTTPLPFDNAVQLLKTKSVTQEVPALNQNGTQGSRMLSGQDTPGETSNTKTVVIIVAIISVLAALVAITILLLYIRKRRRNSKKAGAEKNGSVGESGETLLSHNKNGDHKSTNDGSSQEMKPLNSKPREENGVDSGAGGDCDVINEKEDEATTNITV